MNLSLQEKIDCSGDNSYLLGSDAAKGMSGASGLPVDSDSVSLSDAEFAYSKPVTENVTPFRSETVVKRVFKNLFRHLEDDIESQENDDTVPPGTEDHVEISLPLNCCQFQPSVCDEFLPKIGVYVTTALCRQKLHDDVLRKWKSSFLSVSLNESLASWRSSRKRQSLSKKKATALSRQKLHDGVLREWKSSVLNFDLRKFLISWRSLRRIQSDSKEVFI